MGSNSNINTCLDQLTAFVSQRITLLHRLHLGYANATVRYYGACILAISAAHSPDVCAKLREETILAHCGTMLKSDENEHVRLVVARKSIGVNSIVSK